MLNIEIKRATQVPGIYSCYLSFSGYNENWIAVIRQFNTRKYDKDTKTWEFPLYNLSDIVSRYQNVPITDKLYNLSIISVQKKNGVCNL